MKYLGKIVDNKDLVTKEYVDNAVSATRHVATYSNANGSNDGKYYKISINSYTGWMLLFKISVYHQYESYEFAVSGYNYGTRHWYSPAVMMLTSSYYRTIEFTFGYDSDWHLWVAFPAAQYTGLAVSLEANGFTQVADEKNLFTIELVEGIPETAQTTKSCVRPWYRNETVSRATAADTAYDAGDSSMKVHPQSSNEVNFGGTANSDTIYMGYRARDSKPIPAKFVFGGSSGTATIQAATFTGNVNGTAANVTGVVAAANGGTGKTNLNDAANALINSLSTGSSDPTDNDYYVSQYAGGGTATTTYHRRPVSALWNYIKGKISSVLGLTATEYGGKAATAGTADSATNASKVNNHTVNKDVPSDAKFTDTITTATTTGSGNAVTAISATDGALTVTKGTTFLTSHQDISGKADKSATVSTVTYDSTNKKLTKTINGSTTDVVTVATLKTALGSMPASDVYSWAKASKKPTYTAAEVGALPSSTSVPTAISELDNDVRMVVAASGTASGYLAKFSEGSKITNGPQLGSSTTTFLRNDGTWAVPPSGGGGNPAAIYATGSEGEGDYSAGLPYAEDEYGNSGELITTNALMINGGDIPTVTTSLTPNLSASTGTIVSAEMRKYGNVVQLTLTFKNTSSVASGSNVFAGTLNTYKPSQLINGVCYYSNHALVMSINTAGGIIIRNAGNTAVTCSENTVIGATWII